MISEPWLETVFGIYADDVREGIRHSVVTAVEEAGLEYESSKYKSPTVYGVSRYNYVPIELRSRMESQFTVETRTVPGGLQYVILNGTLLYPWHYADDSLTDPAEVSFDQISGIREDLFGRLTEVREEASLFDDVDLGNGSVGEEDGYPSTLRAVMIAYSANVLSGVQRIVLGDVVLQPDNSLSWVRSEELSLVAGQGLAGMPSAGRDFEDVEAPSLDIGFYDDPEIDRDDASDTDEDGEGGIKDGEGTAGG